MLRFHLCKNLYYPINLIQNTLSFYTFIVYFYLDISTIISTPAILIKRAFTDAHRPFLRAGRLMTNMQMTFASIPNPQQTAISTPSTINFNKSEYSGFVSMSSFLFSIFIWCNITNANLTDDHATEF